MKTIEEFNKEVLDNTDYEWKSKEDILKEVKSYDGSYSGGWWTIPEFVLHESDLGYEMLEALSENELNHLLMALKSACDVVNM